MSETKKEQALVLALRTLEDAAANVTWVDPNNQRIILTYGFHVSQCRRALDQIRELLGIRGEYHTCDLDEDRICKICGFRPEGQ